jgi:hypothetical protein
VKAKVPNAGQIQNRFETSFHALTLTLHPALRRENPILSDDGWEVLYLRRQFGVIGTYRTIDK